MVTKVEKKYLDSIWLNPKYCNNRQSAAKPERGGSTTIPKGSRQQAFGCRSGVYPNVKTWVMI